MDPKNVLGSFKVRDELNPKFWGESSQLDPKIRKVLLKVAKNFIEGWNINKKIPIKDVRFTGSLANYNWSKFSDIDLHVIIDYAAVNKDEELVRRLFALMKSNWNDAHDIPIHGFEVEVYVENDGESHAATGLYSVMQDKWLKQPDKKSPSIDEDDVMTKASYFFRLYEILVGKFKKGQYQEVITSIEKAKEKLKRMRTAGLERDGEFSVENLAFKVLRRTDLLEKYNNLLIKATDKGILEREKVQ
jgi:hypothetical protein